MVNSFTRPNILHSPTEHALCYAPETANCNDWLAQPERFAQADTVRLLAQLIDDGYAELIDQQVCIPWADLYRFLASEQDAINAPLLNLPAIEPWQILLKSRNGFTDSNFSILLDGWRDPHGKPAKGTVKIQGGMLEIAARHILLPKETWELWQALNDFQQRRHRGEETPSANNNRRSYSEIRHKAIAANAGLTDFIRKTVVLTPEKLNIELRKNATMGNQLVEIFPNFTEQPVRWLEIFDKHPSVKDNYDIPSGAGLTHIIISPEVKTVLSAIKNMPGRRLAGKQAEAFLRNPFATLGPHANRVIDSEQFEKAVEDAGFSFAHFTAHILRDQNNTPYETGLLITESLRGVMTSELLRFNGQEQLGQFIKLLKQRITENAQCCAWQGFELEILGDTEEQLNLLEVAWHNSKIDEHQLSTIFDLANYSERIDGFGIEQQYYSPFIAKIDAKDAWFPDNIAIGILFTPEQGGKPIALLLDESAQRAFSDVLDNAKKEGKTSFSFPRLPEPITVEHAEEIERTFSIAKHDIDTGNFPPKEHEIKIIERKGLVIKPNIEAVDYQEVRTELQFPPQLAPKIPTKLQSCINLKAHQKQGLAWLQHLWSHAPHHCRGALLADDMGLGKTIQLLCLFAEILEKNPNIDPFLVVAPVSLLDNWQTEIDKFFKLNTFPVLTLYGSTLKKHYLPDAEIDAAVSQQIVGKLLREGWLGNAKLVLTSYETLRDLEFSLARQKWSVMVCDEAQKIKNPNAMVSRSAKKQNACFRIACTGTPVENSLVDLWCLFDFIQPGLLGALNDFGSKYRKPIETKTEEERLRVEELRTLIQPQLLRRMKTDIADDLPRKFELHPRLSISPRQRQIYSQLVASFKRGQVSGSTYLGTLHALRMLCATPIETGKQAAALNVCETLPHSPKLKWLLETLADIQQKNEKAIVFCEFKDLQLLIKKTIAERFAYPAKIVNGDTSTATKSNQSRQRIITDFQQASGFGVMILSPIAVGFGVNVQKANHVIHFTRHWNPAKEDQATDRAYRIGQEKDVYVHYPIITADDFVTFDDRLDQLLTTKRELAKDMLNGAGDISIGDIDINMDDDKPNNTNIYLLSIKDILEIKPLLFEKLCALLWYKQGYSLIHLTPESGDGGVDIVAISENKGVLIQCKHSTKEGNRLGWEAIKDVSAGANAYRAKHPNVDFSLAAITNQNWNETAQTQAKHNNVRLYRADDLEDWLRQYPIMNSELTNFLL